MKASKSAGNLSLVALLVLQAAQAQENVIPVKVSTEDSVSEISDPTPTANRMIEEIIVTAQKREQNLQDVPISVAAFSADMLDARGIEEPKALQLVTPGLQYNVIVGYSIIFIRGLGTNAYIPSADQSVASYVDNVYLALGQGIASNLGEIERVEVLKGPQGTLFGRNATGGAINIILKQPGPEATTSIVASRESYDKFNARVYTNIPLTDSFAVSVSGLNYEEDPYYSLTDATSLKSLPKETVRGFSVKAGWQPVEDFHGIFGYTYTHTQGAQAALLVPDDIKPLGKALGVKKEPDYKYSGNYPASVDTVSRVTTADLKYAAPVFDVRFIGSKQHVDAPVFTDFEGSPGALVGFGAAGQIAKTTTAELQVLSNADSWGSDWLEWLGGLYHIKSRGGFDPLILTVGTGVLGYLNSPPAGGPLDALNATPPLLDLLARVPGTGGLQRFLDAGVTLNLLGLLETKSSAAFFQTTAHITDELALTLGGRYQKETRELTDSATRVAPNSLEPDKNLITVIDFGSQKKDTSNFSPKAVLDYKLTDQDMVYLSYSKGFKSGTFNVAQVYKESPFVKPEQTDSYELGFKGTFLDGSLRLNAAVFDNYVKNLQVVNISLLGGGAVRLENAGNAEIKGADFDILWQVLPDTLPGLVLSVGGAYLDGEYTDYKSGSGYDETTGLFFDGTIFPTRDFTGNRTIETPKFSGTTGLSYAFDVHNGSIEVAGEVYYNNGFYYSAQNTDTARENSYSVVNARVSYLYDPWGIRISIFGKNIADAKYHYTVTELDFDTAKTLAPPAIYGVKLQWQF